MKVFTLMLLMSISSFASIKVESFNTGLAHTFVFYSKERLAPIIENLRKSNADVICLQEVWKKSDRKKISKELKDTFPHQMMTKIKQTRSKRRPTCKIREVFGKGKFVTCMSKKCKGKKGDEFTDCIINTCGDSLEKLKNQNRECATSIMAQVGKNPIAGIANVINPFVKAGLFTYGGGNGLMILSKEKLENKKVLDLSKISTLSRRQALMATVKKDSKSYNLACTHLTADLSKTVPYTGKFEGGWNAENFAQVRKLESAKLFEESNATILMGDFNCSLKDIESSIGGESEKSCLLFKKNGYFDFVSNALRKCTFCSRNTLNDINGKNVALDHIFSKNVTFLSGGRSYLDDVKINVDGKDIYTNLSDHYGVWAEFE